MTALQTVNLGTAPTGTDGDTVRVANVKANANVAVLNTQTTLTSASPNAVRDLTAADMGKRINFTPTVAGSVHFPKASDTGADQIVSVHNLATAYDITMAIATGSGDTAPTIVVVKPGEMLTWETDGVSQWRTIGRKKAFDEVVQGKLSVVGAATVASLAIGATASISSAGAFSGASAGYTGNVTVGGTLSVTGQATFTLRPVFNNNTPWDSGNFTPGNYAALSGGPSFAGEVSATTQLRVKGATYGVMIRNDDTTAYLMQTASGSPSGTYNSYRPFAWNLSSGAVSIDGTGVGVTTGGSFTVTGAAQINGSATRAYSTFGYINSGGAGSVSGTASSMGCGLFVSNGCIANQFWAVSDRRLKENIAPLDEDYALRVVRDLVPYTFNMRGESHSKRGFMAQDAGKLAGESILNAFDSPGLAEEVDPDGWVSPADTGLGVDYDQIVPIHAAVLRNLLARIEALEARA
ncbi:tail fiber domain-containing protein [Paraburkholderia tropica]|uniref:tail fiber domain-containing protein n=1 Tax=Paraburkholderia tropica TaxID=92647 RepID=UPI0030195F66